MLGLLKMVLGLGELPERQGPESPLLLGKIDQSMGVVQGRQLLEKGLP